MSPPETRPEPQVLVVTGTQWLALGRMPALLRHAGCRVSVFSHPRAPVARCRRLERVVAHDWEPEPARFLEALRQHLAANAYDWVVLGDDFVLNELRRRAEEQWVQPLLPVDVARCPAEAAASKIAFARWMDGAGVPVPAWGEAATIEQAREAAARIGYPVILKPDFGLAGSGVSAAENAQELDAAFRAATAGGERAIVQRFLHGRVGLLEALLDRGRPVAWIVSLKARTSPGPFGASSARRFIHRPEVKDHLARLGHATGLHGFCGLDFVEDEAGAIAYIELNARPTSGLPLGPIAGVDFAAGVRAMFDGTRATQAPRDFTGREPYVPMFPEELMRIGRERDYGALPALLVSRHFWRNLPWGEPRLWRPYMGRVFLAFRG